MAQTAYGSVGWKRFWVYYGIEERGQGMKDIFFVHTVNAYRRCRGIAARIPNLGNRWR